MWCLHLDLISHQETTINQKEWIRYCTGQYILCPTDTGTRKRREEKGHSFLTSLWGRGSYQLNRILPHFNRPHVMFTQNQQHTGEIVQDKAERICKHSPVASFKGDKL